MDHRQPHTGNGTPPPRITRDDVMTAAEVAEMLNLSRAAVYRLANTGQIPSIRLGRTVRFLRQSIEAMLRAE